MGQKRVLLRLVEAVDFIDKQNRRASLLQGDFCLVDCLAYVLHAGEYGGNRQKLGVETLRQNPRQRRLAHARRPPQQHRMRLPAFHRHAQRLAFAD